MDSPRFAITIEPLNEADGGGYLATVPDLPGCVSDGATDVEALHKCSRRHRGLDRTGRRHGAAHPQADPATRSRLTRDRPLRHFGIGDRLNLARGRSPRGRDRGLSLDDGGA